MVQAAPPGDGKPPAPPTFPDSPTNPNDDGDISQNNIDDLIAAANTEGKDGLTAAGRALQKKLGRPDEAPAWRDLAPEVGNPAGYSNSALQFVRNVLTNPETRVTIEYGRNLNGQWDNLIAFRLPIGIGIRYTQSGQFVGFVT
ncbi:hypothetical protein [Frankia sp. Cj5]|uniref:hypothetical protein n=1 Tax=Frankia sp. Cj5 TaxID=2880978 RepID=UPI001EF70511|nr:hypothetical protein [Frankia sp. Cj5]